MNRTHIACCLSLAALVATPAQAQSQVTVYGVADIALGYGKSDDKIFTGVIGAGGLAGPRFGLRGSEDLGDGLSLLFTIEQGYNIGNGQELRPNRTFGRQSWVGLKGGFGTVSAGYQYAPGYLVPYKYQVMLGTPGLAPRSIAAFGGGYTITPASPARWDNSLRYAGDFGGVGVQAIYAFHAQQSDDGTSDRKDDDRWGLSLTYDGGPIGVGVVYHNVGSGSDADDTREVLVGAAYDLGVAKLVGTWSKKDADGSTAGDNTIVSAGVIVPVGAAGTVHVGAAKLNPRGDDNNSHNVTLGYIQTLSKRTSAYAAVNRLTFDDGATYTGTPGASPTSVATAGESTNSLIVGISHKF
ncbi:MAG: porin [Rhodocyclaceae bacterium]|nr:porin [Rhodocyclaceae bacterium]